MITLDSGSTFITLRDPQFGNTRTIHLGTTIKNARDGTKWAYAKPVDQETLNLRFRQMDREMSAAALQFLRDTAGQTITLRMDEDSSIWIGKIMNDPFQTSQEGRFDNTLDLVFVGKKNA